MSTSIIHENREYWTRRAPGYSEVNREELATRQREIWKNTLIERINGRFPGRAPRDIHVLEVGTGPGFFAILLAEAGYRVTAIDLTPSMLDEARQNAGALCGRIAFMEMNAQALQFDDHRFDVILSRNVTWNLPDPVQAYRDWKRVLRPGGVLLNFDANWYAYLFNEEKQAAFARDRANVRRAGVEDHEAYEDSDTMERLSLSLPMGREARPGWDLRTLCGLGFASVSADATAGERVWNPEEKLNYASTPGFLIRAVK